MTDIVSAIYMYYIVVIAIFVYLYLKKQLNKEVARIVVLYALPIILFAYFKLFDAFDFFNKVEKILEFMEGLWKLKGY